MIFLVLSLFGVVHVLLMFLWCLKVVFAGFLLVTFSLIVFLKPLTPLKFGDLHRSKSPKGRGGRFSMFFKGFAG